jgi:hypothetical protein
LRSDEIDLAFWQDYCKRIFGKPMETRPHMKKTNLFYGGMKIHGTNIFFSNGSEDPW